MLARITAIAAIFLATTLCWIILAGTISSRTHSSAEHLSSRVESVWGSAQVQAAPWCQMDGLKDEVEEVVEKGVTRKVTKKVQIAIPVSLDQSKIDAALHLEHRQKGLLWYSTYTIAFNAAYQFRNPEPAPRTLRLYFPLPAEQALYDGLQIRVNGQPYPLDIKSKMIVVNREAAPSEVLNLDVKYKSQGLGSWRYSFGENVTAVRSFAMKMTTNFHDIDFPDNTLAPGSKRQTPDGWELNWNYESLLSGYQIAKAMPEKLHPGPLAAEISYFAPVSLFFFFFLMFLVTTLRSIELHPMNYFFLAAAFFAFHLLLAYLVDHIDIHAAFVLASAVSIGLVASYLRLVCGNQFAFREAALGQLVYLVLFSYAFFFRGFTGLAVTIGAIATLFVAMQATARIRWREIFAPPPPAPPLVPRS